MALKLALLQAPQASAAQANPHIQKNGSPNGLGWTIAVGFVVAATHASMLTKAQCRMQMPRPVQTRKPHYSMQLPALAACPGSCAGHVQTEARRGLLLIG